MDNLTPVVADALIKKSEGLLKALFGSAVKEMGETITDKLRARRFKNQLAIFAKASDQIRESGLQAKPLLLKHLVPLLDLSSLEEEPAIQQKWANIITNLAGFDSLEIFNKNCIELLNKLSHEEVNLMDVLYEKFINEQGEVVTIADGRIQMKDYREVHSEDIAFDPWEIGEQLHIETLRIKLYIENLVALGLLQFEEMELEDDSLIKSFNVHLSYLGLYFVRLCKF